MILHKFRYIIPRENNGETRKAIRSPEELSNKTPSSVTNE